MRIKEIIKQAIDFHVHVSPDLIPRKYNSLNLFKSQRDKLKNICVKSHSFSTVDKSNEINKIFDSNFLIGSIVLNNFTGGMNPDIIYANAQISDSPFIVWFPTIHADNYLKQSKWEIKPEWINNPNFESRKSEEVEPVTIIKNGKLTKQTIKVLRTIKKYNCILATGHVSWREAEKVVRNAMKIGIKKIIVTHPIYQIIDMPIEIQKKLTKRGAFVEHCYSMNSIDRISYDRIVEQIKNVGAENCIISSDVGQTFSPDPDVALKYFIKFLIERGLTFDEIYQMAVKNSQQLFIS